MYSKFVLAVRFCLAEMAILVGKWPMAKCYFKLFVGVVIVLISLILRKKFHGSKGWIHGTSREGASRITVLSVLYNTDIKENLTIT